jgi:hypothetical protein
MISIRQVGYNYTINQQAERSGVAMGMDIPTEVPFILKAMVAVISVVTFFLMALLTVKIYRDEARPENAGPKNKGW